MTDAAILVDALDRAGYRVTQPRRAVAELVARRSGHFSAAELVTDARRRRGVGRATVFRTLDLLTEVGVVERVDLPNGGHAYVGCEPSHHHHVICTSCGRTAEVADCGMREVAREVERVSGYRVASHRLELFGICPDCGTDPSPAGG
jgi:Fur family ferric uptake transcriptional regulator